MLRLIGVKRNVLFTSDDGQSSNYWNPWKTDVFRQRCSCANENLTRICVTSLEASLPFRIVIMVSNVKWTSTCSHLSNIHNGLVSHWIIEIIEKIDVFRRRCSCLNEPQNLTRNGERISRNIHSVPQGILTEPLQREIQKLTFRGLALRRSVSSVTKG